MGWPASWSWPPATRATTGGCRSRTAWCPRCCSRTATTRSASASGTSAIFLGGGVPKDFIQITATAVNDRVILYALGFFFFSVTLGTPAPADARTEAIVAITGGEGRIASANVESPPLPIAVETLTARHEFTDDIRMQVRVQPDGRPTEVVNLKDASNIAVLRFTVQPGVRFPWHSHPGLVLVTITQGELVFVYADDCVRRPYATGTAFVDPGFGNVHYAFNPTGEETVLVATFLGVPRRLACHARNRAVRSSQNVMLTRKWRPTYSSERCA